MVSENGGVELRPLRPAMKASDLIASLQEAIRAHGDLVVFYSDDCCELEVRGVVLGVSDGGSQYDAPEGPYLYLTHEAWD